MRRAALALILAFGLPATSIPTGAQTSVRSESFFTASDGRRWPVQGAGTDAGIYYIAVRVRLEVPPPAKRSEFVVPLTFWGRKAFTFVSDQGLRYPPTILPSWAARPLETPCPEERMSLNAGTMMTCDLLFKVPNSVTSGMVEFESGVPSRFQRVSVKIQR
jgi:hypothetical protein